jgi:hypothetical protein
MPVYLIHGFGWRGFFLLVAVAGLLGACARERSEMHGASVDGHAVASSAAQGTFRMPMPPGLASRLDLVTGTASQFGIDEQAPVWAVVVDLGGMSVAVLRDGTSTLYLEGDRPAAGHECHGETARLVCAAATAKLDMSAASSDFKQPTVGRVKFFFLTPGGSRTAEASIDELDQEQHPLHDLFLKTQHIFYEPRVVPEPPDARCRP